MFLQMTFCPILWLNNIQLYICTTSSLPISLLMDIHVLAIVKSAIRTLEQMYIFELWFSLGMCPLVGLLGHMIVLFLVFKELPYCYP